MAPEVSTSDKDGESGVAGQGIRRALFSKQVSAAAPPPSAEGKDGEEGTLTGAVGGGAASAGSTAAAGSHASEESAAVVAAAAFWDDAGSAGSAEAQHATMVGAFADLLHATSSFERDPPPHALQLPPPSECAACPRRA